MNPASSIRAPARALAFRLSTRNRFLPRTQSLHTSDSAKEKSLPVAEGTKGPNSEPAPHVSEEQAMLDKSMGQTPPDISQGTPVEEVLQRDKDGVDSAPQVIKDEIKGSTPTSPSGQKRAYSTSARRLAKVTLTPASSQPLISENGLISTMSYPDAGPGHKFPMPDIKSMSRMDHLRRRYDPIVDQLTKAIMRHGKLSQAQQNMSNILSHLRTAPPPAPNPQFPSRTLLLTDVSPSSNSTYPASYDPKFAAAQAANPSLTNPTTSDPTTLQTAVSLPRSTLPLHPIEYLTTTIDSVSPLIKIRQQRGAAGGGAALPIPVPLGIRQRRRQAIQWILSAADNRREIRFSERVAREIVKVADGSSTVWERRAMVHRLAVSARSNVKPGAGRKRSNRR